MTQSISPDRPAPDAFPILWALAILLHQATSGDLASSPLDLALTFLATAVLLRPDEPRIFLGCLVCQVISTAIHLPRVENHWIFALWIATTILVFQAVHALRALRSRSQANSVSLLLAGRQAAAPWLQRGMIVLYAVAVLHKVNAGFLDPGTSCAVALLQPALRLTGIGVLSAGWSYAAICLSLVIEGGLPFLLLWPRGRRWGLVLGVAFHFGLGLLGYHCFSAVILAAYSLFLPQRSADAHHNAEAERRRRTLLCALPMALGIAFVAFNLSAGQNSWKMQGELAKLIWIPLGLWGLVTFIRAALQPRAGATPGAPPTWSSMALGGVLLGLLVVNGLCPYLGVKTDASFSMYSNLQTEGGRWNHLLIPGAVKRLSLVDDLVTVSRAGPRGLQDLVDDDRLVPVAELIGRLHGWRDGTPLDLELRRGGSTLEPMTIEELRALVPPYPRWLDNLLSFRSVPRTGEARCQH